MANYASSARPPPDVVAATHADGRPFYDGPAPTASVPAVDTTASYPAAETHRLPPGLPELRRHPWRLHLQNLLRRRRDLPLRPVRPLCPARGLCKILLHRPADLAAMQTLIEILCGVDRTRKHPDLETEHPCTGVARRNHLRRITTDPRRPHSGRIRPSYRSPAQPAATPPTAPTTR
jgi:hypothetical protein